MNRPSSPLLLLLLCVLPPAAASSSFSATNLVNKVTPAAKGEDVVDPNEEEQWMPNPEESLIGQEIPSLKMLKRQIRNFRAGSTASITLVYVSSLNVTIRWFREDTEVFGRHRSGGDAEVNGMFPIHGDASYTLKMMTSGQVTASTLSIPGFRGNFPVEYEAVISSECGTQQYQIRTKIVFTTDNLLEDIDSPEWMIVPKTDLVFQPNSELTTQCKVFVPNEKLTRSNELFLMRLVPSLTPRPNEVPTMDFTKIMSTHKLTTDAAEKYGADNKQLLQGRRQVQARGHVLYEIRFWLKQANSTYEGMYQCNIERNTNHRGERLDKAYFVSSVTMGNNKSPFKSNPKAELIACNMKQYDSRKRSLLVVEGEEACVRCRGYGFPRPNVAIYKDGSEVQDVQKYVNVADGGVAEATYTFRSPGEHQRGTYSCRAANDNASHHIEFSVKFKSRRNLYG